MFVKIDKGFGIIVTVPSQIEWLGIGEVTEESVTINWKPPIERNGIIIGIVIDLTVY
jgi:hypothetical protein